jgi:hypothetical protein
MMFVFFLAQSWLAYYFGANEYTLLAPIILAAILFAWDVSNDLIVLSRGLINRAKPIVGFLLSMAEVFPLYYAGRHFGADHTIAAVVLAALALFPSMLGISALGDMTHHAVTRTSASAR